MPDHSANQDRNSSTARSIGHLTFTNILIILLGFASVPLQARSLGPEGRGDLAAIIVPLTFLVLLGDFGLGMFARREAAACRRHSVIIGSLGPIFIILGVAVSLAVLPLVPLFAKGRPHVSFWLYVGLLAFPINLFFASLMTNIVLGLERWRLWAAYRMIGAAGWTLSLAMLSFAGHLTVSTAAGSFLMTSLLANGVLLGLVFNSSPRSFDRLLLRRAASFGMRAWVANLAGTSSQRLDQLLMVSLVSNRELGLYAVAVSFAGITAVLGGSVGLAILPRLSRNDSDVLPRALRVSLMLVVFMSLVLGVLAWPFIHYLTGPSFWDAVPIIWVLLAASIPLAGSATLSQAMFGAGYPWAVASSELVSLAITTVGLLVVLGRFGAVGAAWVSLLAYGSAFVWLLGQASMRLGYPVRHLLIIRKADIDWCRQVLRRLVLRLSPRLTL